VHVTCPYPQPAESSPYLTTHHLKIHHIIIITSKPGSPKWSLSLRFRQQTPVYTTAAAHDSTADANSPQVGWHLITHTNGTFPQSLTNTGIPSAASMRKKGIRNATVNNWRQEHCNIFFIPHCTTYSDSLSVILLNGFLTVCWM